MSPFDINACPNGPLLISGTATCLDSDGNETVAPGKNNTIALCRCGLSANKPFCDGAHRSNGFEASALTVRVQLAD